MSTSGMTSRKPRAAGVRKDGLSRDRIVAASIALLDKHGESGLTFRALCEQLQTGAGAIYWHIADRSDLLVTACDAIVVQALATQATDLTPQAAVHSLGLAVFDAIDRHPWVGAALARAPGEMPVVRILDRLGQQVHAMGAASGIQWSAACTLLSYILGVGRENAANTRIASEKNLDRSTFLEELAGKWSQLDAESYPFVHRVSTQLPAHNDEDDFIAGLDFILAGIQARVASDDTSRG